jgi:hypothetical protein
MDIIHLFIIQNSIIMKKSTLLSLLFIFTFCLIAESIKSQTISYKVIENKPYKSVLEVGIVPLDLVMLDGNPMIGPGLDVKFRPLKNVHVFAGVGNGLYSNAIDDKSAVTGIKKSGGLFFDANAEFVWYRKGVNFKDPANEAENMKYKLIMKSTTSGNISTTTSLLFPFNRSVERSIRGGFMTYNFPWDMDDNEVSSLTGPFAGISKRTYKYAEVEAEGYGNKKRSEMYGYYFDLLFGSANYFDPALSNKAGTGFRFGIEYYTVGGLMPVGVVLEMGSMPQTGGYLRAKYIFSLEYGKHSYEGDYVMRKKAKRKLPAIIQALI